MTNHVVTLVSNYTYNVNAKSLEHCDTEYQTTFSEKMQKIGESMDKAGSKIKGNSSQGRGWEGKSDGANLGGELGGTRGMYKAADLLDGIGDKLSYIPTPATQFLGKAYSISADGLRTIADYNTPEITSVEAGINAGIRIGTFAVGEKIGDDIKKAGFDKSKEYIYDQSARKLLDNIKEEGIVKPKE